MNGALRTEWGDIHKVELAGLGGSLDVSVGW